MERMGSSASKQESSCLVTTGTGSGEIVEKKSRFIAEVFPVESVSKAEEHIREVVKRSWDARHHCYAWTIGELMQNTRCSDDGEPSGTAGKPILAVLTGAGVTNTLIVVTRYFGGTLLGTGGLVRAYSQAAQAGLASAPLGEKVRGCRITIDIEYSFVQPLQRYLSAHGLEAAEVEYGENASFRIDIISSDIESFCEDITGLTEGRAEISRGEEHYFLRDVKQDRR